MRVLPMASPAATNELPAIFHDRTLDLSRGDSRQTRHLASAHRRLVGIFLERALGPLDADRLTPPVPEADRANRRREHRLPVAEPLDARSLGHQTDLGASLIEQAHPA